MADITITATSLVPGTGARMRDVVLAGTLATGAAVYLDATNNNEATAADASAAGTAYFDGILMLGGASNQVSKIIYDGHLTMSGTTAGVLYCVSATAGGIAPVTDLLSTEYVVIIGLGTSTGLQIIRDLNQTQVAKP